MEDAEKQVQGQEYTGPTSYVVEKLTPSHGLYQPSFDLSEADFLRLKQANPVFTAMGGSVLSFSLAYGLPLIVRRLANQQVIATEDIVVFVFTLVAGCILLFIGLFFSKERRDLMKEIDGHFKNNPAEIAYRLDDR